METKEEIIEYCNKLGKDIEQLDGSEFIDKYLVDEQFHIHKNLHSDTVYIDLLSGINYYGEVHTTIEVHANNTFRVERLGTSVGEFHSDDLWETVHDDLQDFIYYDNLYLHINEVRE